ncbi:ROK family transcriptional regulator [Alteribacter natronophilus]|uniref:ROK family transcriptional regulator n=1 Tax=Alteribacter natronophilus TaxID=2583810 RepID=UPI00110F0EF1|nr:ROK family transcriptional regulator [Alteribacter natronophilus]TMW71021.1 ROK family protein [Alteribacter natronophilus]
MKMIQTFNQHVVKKRNKSLVLHSIIHSYPISRAGIAAQTGLNKGTVSSMVSDLLEEDLISESGPGVSSGGRRPVMLLFNQSAGYSIGIDIGVNYILAVLCDLQGNICNEKQMKVENLSLDDTQDLLFQVIDALIKEMPESTYGVVGIGIGVPGTVSLSGEILLAPNLDWKNADLKSVIEDRYQVPVRIENEANAGAYGEKKFGAGKELNDIIYISGGIGIGVGLILNGELYRGHNGLSGELGHMTINMEGPVCKCGNRGCWELYASEKALLKLAREQNLSRSGNSLSLEDIIFLAETGDAETIKLIQAHSRYLAVGINSIINSFNPEQIIIGNRLVLLQEWLEPALADCLNQQGSSPSEKDFEIHFSKLEKRSAALGVAAFSAEQFLAVNIEEKTEEMK